MPLVKIDGNNLKNWESFHDTFSKSFGFPEFYGRNMGAWIDCMTDLDDPNEGVGMTSIHGSASDVVVLHIDNIDSMPNELSQALIDCAAFVNWRRLDQGEPAILALSYDRQP
tara:strand:+ start:2065 stop:2400 length:336 start_codon:yes stop_codon:yes gene_type:complete